MEQNTKADKTVIAPVVMGATDSQTIEYLVYFVFGVIDILLIFRLILKVMGASAGSTFVNFIYAMTGILVAPFEGIFSRGVNKGLETTSILEPSVIIAIIVYALLAWGIVKLVRILSGERQENV